MAGQLALGVFATCVLALSPGVALGQRGGSHAGGHVGGGIGGHSGGGASHARSAASRPGPTATGSPGSSVNVNSTGHAGSATVSSQGTPPPASAGSGPNVVTTAGGERRFVEGTPRSVTIGFPPRSPDEPRISSVASGGRSTFSGDGNQFWEEQIHRGATAAALSGAGAAVAAPRTVPAVRTSRRGGDLPSVAKLGRGNQPGRGASSFVIQPVVTSPPHIWLPRKNAPRNTYGGFGVFGFGFGYPFLDFGFGPDCNPLWLELGAFGCDMFGYWDGYNAGYNVDYETGADQTDVLPSVEESSQERPSTYVSAPERAPEQNQAEEVSVVLYMKSGVAYMVTDCWIADGKLHYRPSYGGENTIEMDDLDLQETVDANAKRGVNFTLNPSPR
jgi:hypothetical protein